MTVGCLNGFGSFTGQRRPTAKRHMRIDVLVTDGVFDLGLAAVLDTFRTANQLARARGIGAGSSDVRLVGVRRRVRSAQGFAIPVTCMSDARQADAIVIPAMGSQSPEAIDARLRRPDQVDAAAALMVCSAHKPWIGAACSGTFFLAESGLLEGQRATTSWWLAPYFRHRFPAVALEETTMLVQSAHFVTAGAALAHVDLALSLVRRQNASMASLTARYLFVEPRASQVALAMPDYFAHRDPITEKFERWARGRLHLGFSLDDAARNIGTSTRTLARRLHHSLGKTPLAYFQDLRVAYAIHQLQTTDLGIEQIAAGVGYSDGVTLRTLIRRKVGKGIREFRMRKGSRGPNGIDQGSSSPTASG
jgi:transcriptional regulator GlxA family with amidase domain